MNPTAHSAIGTLPSHLNRQVSQSLPLIFAAGCACCVLFLLECNSLTGDSRLVILGMNSLVLALFVLSSLVLRRWAIPPAHAHFVLFLTAMIILTVGSVGALLGQERAYNDTVVLTLVASGCFILDYYWLVATAGAVTSVFYQTRCALATPPSVAEFSTVLIAVMASFLFCYIRRSAYRSQFEHRERERALSDKLKGIWRESHVSRWETEERLNHILSRRQELELELEEKKAALAKLRISLENSRKSGSLGRLAGGVAHDFNNLLTVIFFNLDELSESVETPEVSADLVSARKAAERVTGLTSQLLSLSRRQVIKKELLDPVVHAKTLEPTLRQLLGEDTIVNLDFQVQTDTIKLEADPALMDRVLLTLASSGRNVEKRGGEFTLRITQGSDEVAYLVTHSEWKEPDGEPPTLPYASGEDLFTGLGLSLAAVEGVIDQHNGQFRVLKDRGSTHYLFSLPMYQPGDEPASRPAPPLLNKPQGYVLILEEDEQVRRLISRYLGRRNIRACTYADCQALRRDSENIERASVLICDYLLPRGDGLKLSRELRQRWPEMKTIFMSGAAEAEFPEDSQHLFLPKPFSLKNLGESVANLLA